MKTTWIFFLGLLFSGTWLEAQDFFEAYKADADKYLMHYSQPFFEGMIFNSSDGWVHTAKAMEVKSLALDINTDYAFIPEAYQTFRFDPAEYQTIDLVDEDGHVISSAMDMPTIFGPDTDLSIRVRADGNTPGTYDEMTISALPGFKSDFEKMLSFLPLGMPGISLQVRAGLPLHSEVMVRYFPLTNYAGAKAEVLGLGLKHELGQYFGWEGNFHLAAYGVYTSTHIGYSPDTLDFRGIFDLNIMTAGAVASQDYKIVSFYGGLSYIRGWNKLQVLGSKTYTYDITDSHGNVITQQSETLNDPLHLRFAVNEYKAFAGVKFNFWILHIFVQYNFQKYPGLNAGLSLGM